MDGRTWIAGHRYGQGSQDMDTDMDRRTGIAGHGHGHKLHSTAIPALNSNTGAMNMHNVYSKRNSKVTGT